MVRSTQERYRFALCLSFRLPRLDSFPPFAPGELRPNPSLKLTRYGRLCKPGLRGCPRNELARIFHEVRVGSLVPRRVVIGI
jgi:hypothetical protein